MTSVVLVIFLAAPPDLRTYQQVLNQTSVRLRVLYQKMGSEPHRVISDATDILNDDRLKSLAQLYPALHSVRDQVFFLRVQQYLQQEQPGRAIQELTDSLEAQNRVVITGAGRLVGAAPFPLHALHSRVPPHRLASYSALMLRATAWQKLGDEQRAGDDQVVARRLMSEYMAIHGIAEPRVHIPDGATGKPRWNFVPYLRLFLLILPLCIVVIGWVAFFLMGLRQRRDGQGRWLRLTLVSLILAIALAAPVGAAVVLLALHTGREYTASLLGVTMMVFIMNLIYYRTNVNPVTWGNTGVTPPLVEDEDVLQRIRDLAQGLGVAVPVARLIRSPSSQLMNEAMIAGTVAPSIIVYDGTLYRMKPEERDFILAHELAHVANHSCWWWLLLACLCSIVAVVAAGFVQAMVALTLGWCLCTGSSLIVSRILELDCDRRAAGAIGHRKAASALWSLHADQPFRATPILEFLIGAVSTHPSRDERLAAVAASAPEEDRPDIVWDPKSIFWRKIAAWAATFLWMAVIVGSVFWGLSWPSLIWPCVPMVLASLTPLGLLWLGLRKSMRRASRLQKRKWTFIGIFNMVMPFLLLGCIAGDYFGWTGGMFKTLHGALSLLGILAIWLGVGPLIQKSLGKIEKLEQDVGVAIQSGQFQNAVELCERSPDLVAKSPALRHSRALMLALTGRRADAISGLEEVVRDEPDFKISHIALASLYAEEARYEEALQLCEGFTRDLPDEPVGPRMESWCLRKLGRLDEADAKLVGLTDDESGSVSLLRSGVALSRGDFALAAELLARAERLAPGTTPVALMEVELKLATNAPDVEEALNRARELVKHNPMSFSERELANLTQEWEQRRSSTAPSVE